MATWDLITSVHLYQDFKPVRKLTQEEDSQTIVLDLPGFREDQIRVDADDTTGTVILSGERLLGNNKWRRFHDDVHVPPGRKASDVQMQFEDELLKLKLPNPHLPPASETTHPPVEPKDSPTLHDPSALQPQAKQMGSPQVEPEPSNEPYPTRQLFIPEKIGMRMLPPGRETQLKWKRYGKISDSPPPSTVASKPTSELQSKMPELQNQQHEKTYTGQDDPVGATGKRRALKTGILENRILKTIRDGSISKLGMDYWGDSKPYLHNMAAAVIVVVGLCHLYSMIVN